MPPPLQSAKSLPPSTANNLKLPRIDHKYHISYIRDQISGQSFTILSQRKIIPSYVQMEKRDGPKKPERPKLYPKREVLMMYLSNGGVVWTSEISYDQHNLARVRPGGRDETWTEEIFFQEIQLAIQYPSINLSLVQLRPVQDNFNLEIKSKIGDIVVNYLKPCLLTLMEEIDSQTILEKIELEELALINFFASRGLFEKVRLYLEGSNGKIDLNFKEKGSWVPLQRASYCGHVELVSYLIQKGANVNIESDDGMDPLFCAIKGGHLEVVRFLIESCGAVLKMDNPHEEKTENDHLNHEGHLAYARTCHQREIIEYFCQYGGPIQMNLATAHGVRKTGPPNDPTRFFTIIDGYPVEHVEQQSLPSSHSSHHHSNKKTEKKKSQQQQTHPTHHKKK